MADAPVTSIVWRVQLTVPLPTFSTTSLAFWAALGGMLALVAAVTAGGCVVTGLVGPLGPAGSLVVIGSEVGATVSSALALSGLPTGPVGLVVVGLVTGCGVGFGVGLTTEGSGRMVLGSSPGLPSGLPAGLAGVVVVVVLGLVTAGLSSWASAGAETLSATRAGSRRYS